MKANQGTVKGKLLGREVRETRKGGEWVKLYIQPPASKNIDDPPPIPVSCFGALAGKAKEFKKGDEIEATVWINGYVSGQEKKYYNVNLNAAEFGAGESQWDTGFADAPRDGDIPDHANDDIPW